VLMDSIDALVGGRPEVQAYLNHRFEASVKAGVAEATRRVHAAPYDDTADGSDNATTWGVAQCACTQCDLVRRRTTHAPTGGERHEVAGVEQTAGASHTQALYRAAAAAACEEATARLSGTRESHRAARHELDADDRAEVLCRATEVVRGVSRIPCRSSHASSIAAACSKPWRWTHWRQQATGNSCGLREAQVSSQMRLLRCRISWSAVAHSVLLVRHLMLHPPSEP
jgi:hypothetical protein